MIIIDSLHRMMHRIESLRRDVVLRENGTDRGLLERRLAPYDALLADLEELRKATQQGGLPL
jgi:hypothetical protein